MPRLGRARPHGPADSLPAPPVTRNADALGAWTSALAGLSSVPARWLAIGGGITEGQGAGTKAARWLDTALSTIRTSKSVTGGAGFVSAAYQVVGPDSPWATTSVVRTGNATVGTTSGIGPRSVTLAPPSGGGGQFGGSAFGTAPFGGATGGGAAGTVTFTVTGTSADLWYVSEATSGQLSYAVDGGSATTVATAGAHAVRRISGISLGANASHTVAVTTSNGTVYVSGLTVYAADAGTGIHLYEASRVGATSATHAVAALADLTAAATLIGPDLVTIEVGHDDAAAAIPATDTATNLTGLLAMLRSLPKVPSVVLLVAFHPAPSAVPGWPDYVVALRQMAVADPSLGLVDLSLTLPVADAAGGGLYRAGGRYPNDTGHAAVASAVAAFLNVSVPAAPPSSGSGALLLANVA